MADRSEHERKARIMVAGLANLTTQAAPSHPITSAKPPSETDRVGQIILSNIATKDD